MKRFLFAYSPYCKELGCWVDTTLVIFSMSYTDALYRASLNTGYNEFAFTLLSVEGF